MQVYSKLGRGWNKGYGGGGGGKETGGESGKLENWENEANWQIVENPQKTNPTSVAAFSHNY